MNDDDRTKEALFRHAILGDLLTRSLRRGELRPSLAELSEKTFEDYRPNPSRQDPSGGSSAPCGIYKALSRSAGGQHT